MAINAMNAVWQHFPHGGSDMLVALALADFCDDKGLSLHPSIRTIARKCRLSECHTRRIVHRLIQEKLLEVIGNEFGGDPGKSRQYCFRFDRLVTNSSATPVGDATPSVGATGVADARYPCRPRQVTPSADASQTTIYPPITTSNGADAPSPRRLPACPVEKLIDLYHTEMPDNPRVKVVNAARKRAIAARWQEASRLACHPFDGGYETQTAGVEKWRAFFTTCARSAFLTGHAPPQPGRPPFVADIDFLMSPSGFAKTLENRYHRAAS